MQEEYDEFNSGTIRKSIPWLWKHLELFQGADGIRRALNDKWNSQSVISALILVVTTPLIFLPPADYLDGDKGIENFQILMMMSTVLSLSGTILTLFLQDMMSTICPRPSDLIYFMTLNIFDLPFLFTIGSIATALAGVFLSLEYISRKSTPFRIAFWLCVLICIFVSLVIIYASIFLGQRHLKAVNMLTSDDSDDISVLPSTSMKKFFDEVKIKPSNSGKKPFGLAKR